MDKNNEELYKNLEYEHIPYNQFNIDNITKLLNESILTTTNQLLFKYNSNYTNILPSIAPINEVCYFSQMTPANRYSDILEYEEITSINDIPKTEIIDFKIKELLYQKIQTKNLMKNNLHQHINIDVIDLIEHTERNLNRFKLLISNSLKHKEPYSILTNYASLLNKTISKFLALNESPLKNFLGSIIFDKISILLKDVDEYQDTQGKLISIKNKILNDISPNLINTTTDQKNSLIIDIEEPSLKIDIDYSSEPTNAMPTNLQKKYNLSTPSTLTKKIGSNNWIINIQNKIKNQFKEITESPYENLTIFTKDLVDLIEHIIKKKSPQIIQEILTEITQYLKKNFESPIANIIIKQLNQSTLCKVHSIELITSNVNINMHINTNLNSIISINELFDKLLGNIYATIKDVDNDIFIPAKYLSLCKNLSILRKLAVQSLDEKLQLSILEKNDPFCEHIITNKTFISPKVFEKLKLSKNLYTIEKLYSNPNVIDKYELRKLVFDNVSFNDLSKIDKHTIKLTSYNNIKEKHVNIKQEILDLRDKINNFVDLDQQDKILYAKLKGIARLKQTHPYVLHILATFNDFEIKDIISQNTELNEITASYLIKTEDLILQENIASNPSPYLTKKPQNYTKSPLDMLVDMDIPRFNHFIARRSNLTTELILKLIERNPDDEILFILLSNNYNLDFNAIFKIINLGKIASLTALADSNVITRKSDRSFSKFHNLKVPIKETLNFNAITSNLQIKKSLKMLNDKKIPIVIQTLLENKLVVQHFKPGPPPTTTELQKDIKSIVNLLIENNFNKNITSRLPIQLILQHSAIEDKLNIIYSYNLPNKILNNLIKERNDIVNTAILEITNDTDQIIPNIIHYTNDKKLLEAASLKITKLNKLNIGEIILRPRNTEPFKAQNFKLLKKFRNRKISYKELINLSLSDNINDLEELASNMEPKYIDAWINILSANYNNVRLIAIKRNDLPIEIYEAIVNIVRYDKILEFASKADHIPQHIKYKALKKLEKAKIWNEKRYVRNTANA